MADAPVIDGKGAVSARSASANDETASSVDAGAVVRVLRVDEKGECIADNVRLAVGSDAVRADVDNNVIFVSENDDCFGGSLNVNDATRSCIDDGVTSQVVIVVGDLETGNFADAWVICTVFGAARDLSAVAGSDSVATILRSTVMRRVVRAVVSASSASRGPQCRSGSAHSAVRGFARAARGCVGDDGGGKPAAVARVHSSRRVERPSCPVVLHNGRRKFRNYFGEFLSVGSRRLIGVASGVDVSSVAAIVCAIGVGDDGVA